MLEQAATITKQPARGPNSPATIDSRSHHACNSPEPAHPLRRTTRRISSSQRRRSRGSPEPERGEGEAFRRRFDSQPGQGGRVAVLRVMGQDGEGVARGRFQVLGVDQRARRCSERGGGDVRRVHVDGVRGWDDEDVEEGD
ncbi:hypothetical protein DEO72_LG11g2180 [Vigna unguiculata]|nr:hypothetical protein DEO72_LG11g2180 [Vigna unguiculata]